ncbi:hypothetical protein NCCP2716_23180 [Sporosarcina sp. NCCP-2716]|nr:hypothetical protein [Sporosarcina sp. NCCP-2716]GKV69820.1 hypothetical protein NCCP2716_23180 [Sporosarcina sp. NCCP-2716]
MNDFDKHFKRTGKLIGFIFIAQAVMALAILSGITYVAYLLLKHFGIL